MDLNLDFYHLELQLPKGQLVSLNFRVVFLILHYLGFMK
ncbi:conserved hypothetical protein (plasmid) [Borreliella burgdorferi 156a]|nr:conserved hypothetical protein [Borreliella burgdorferi 156a]ACN23939.1 conserved hypothetical protein [Borreliella burgdorferi 64b]